MEECEHATMTEGELAKQATCVIDCKDNTKAKILHQAMLYIRAVFKDNGVVLPTEPPPIWGGSATSEGWGGVRIIFINHSRCVSQDDHDGSARPGSCEGSACTGGC